MAAIRYREDLLQGASIDDLYTTKVNLSTYNASMNDIGDKFTKVRDDFTAADSTLSDLIATTKQDLIDNEIKANVDAVAVLNGDTDTDGSVDKKIADSITSIVNGAPEAYDTLKELLDLINSDDTDLNALIQQNNDKIAALVGDATDGWKTLEDVETSTKAIRDDLQVKIDDINTEIDDVASIIPHYKYDIGLGITDADNNYVTLSLVPVDDILGGKATVYSTDDDGNITIESINTISKSDADDAGDKDYKIESTDDLTSYKAIIEYFYTSKANA